MYIYRYINTQHHCQKRRTKLIKMTILITSSTELRRLPINCMRVRVTQSNGEEKICLLRSHQGEAMSQCQQRLEIVEGMLQIQNDKIFYMPKASDGSTCMILAIFPDTCATSFLRNIYKTKFAFPEWVSVQEQKQVDERMAMACVYYPKGSTRSFVEMCVKQREPVNIAWDTNVELGREYDQGLMYQYFGWKKGYYGRHYEEKKNLCPNMAVYTRAQYRNQDIDTNLHIINVIGLALDSTFQPDYQFYVKLNASDTLVIPMMQKHYVKAFQFIFRCAQDTRCETVVMSKFGCDNFSKLFNTLVKDKSLSFEESVWRPALTTFYDTYTGDVNMIFMAGPHVTRKKPVFTYENTPFYNKGTFDDVVKLIHKSNTKDLCSVLFVNAWDPWSVPGNGNAGDNSLDGWIGRSTDISILGTAITNPFLSVARNYVDV